VVKKVYLAGPITGLSYGEARHGWREEMKTLLAPGIEAFSPMRGKDHLKHLDKITGDAKSVYASNPMTTGRGITGRDRFDVMTCDVMVAYFLGAEKASVGTCIEFGWADAFRKPVVRIMETDSAKNPHDHLIMNEIATYDVQNLEDAARLVNLLCSAGI
jgi:nucleoside 2-deoxyribosyltransferase